MSSEFAQEREVLRTVMDSLTQALPGVALCIFAFNHADGEPQANYISNADRAATLAAIRGWVNRQGP